MGDIVRSVEKIAPRLSVALVGAYHMQSHPNTVELLKKSINRFNLIVHSRVTPDYNWCFGTGKESDRLPVKIIPNGVYLSEFRDNSLNFRKKYRIKEKYIINSTSNFFFGKGFELLPKIYKKLSEKFNDFTILSISNTSTYPYDKVFLDRTKRQSKGMNIRFMRDLPREDVVAAFKASDVFLMTSKKEVAPIVILECRAAKLPWVSMNVGNTIEHQGGAVIYNGEVDRKGYKIVDNKIINSYLVNIAEMLEVEDCRNRLIAAGQEDIEEIDWKNIVPLYHEVFSNEI